MCNIPTISNILQFLSDRKVIKLPGFQNDIPITRPAPITGAQPGDVTFCGATAMNPQKLVSKTRASLLLIDRNISIDYPSLEQSTVQAVILSDNARLDFMRVVEHFFAQQRPSGIHSSAVIAYSASIGSDVAVGPLCSIADKVKIGRDSTIFAGVHIYDQVRIGKNVKIHSGTVIGKEGWGYERDKSGKFIRFPHIGGVEIGDDVDIGSNVVIDRGALGNTIIKDGCKINNGTHIGHNVEVGGNTIILPHVYLGGSAKVGEACWIGPCVTVRDHIEIGSKAFIGFGSVVTKNIPNGVTVMGSPAREIEDQKKLLEHWSDIIAQAEHG
jgi:UDP-3-O-[3-hydroxymyristoyl] glucosamine N-acyltransferase